MDEDALRVARKRIGVLDTAPLCPPLFQLPNGVGDVCVIHRIGAEGLVHDRLEGERVERGSEREAPCPDLQVSEATLPYTGA